MKHIATLQILGRARLLAGPPGTDPVAVPAKSFALLVYVGMERKRVRREILADMFWGDTGDDSARANLRLALTKLRQRLPGVILADADSVGIDPQATLAVDGLDLLLAAESVRQHSAAALGGAIAHYRGPFLADFQLRDCAAFEDWAGAQRQRIDRSAVMILRELVRQEQQARHLHNELRYLDLWAQIEPWNEEPHMSLLRLLARVGSTAAALDRFEACRQALAETQGVKPSAALTALADDIRRGNVSPVAPPTVVPPRAAPVEALPLLGREADLRCIRQHLARGERLVTLLGPAGVGKSRLARALLDDIAGDFPDGQVLCSLDVLNRDAPDESMADQMVAVLASALGLDLSQTVQPQAMLTTYLASRRVALGLDGFEAVLAAAPALADILQAAPRCVAVVTSRARLALASECVHAVRGLPTGEDGTDAALALLRACATRGGVTLDETRDHGDLQRLLDLLDGSPLAIQFAAPLLRALTPAQLVQRLEHGTWLDSSLHVPEYRHQTLQDVMDDMWDQLDARTQQAWARCALFRGTFARDWVSDCAGVADDSLGALLERSLLVREPDGRLRMHELTRQYGLAMLDGLPDAQGHRRQFSAAVLQRLRADAARLEREEPAAVQALTADIGTLAAALDIALPWADAAWLDAPLAALCGIYHRLGWHFAAARLQEGVLERHAHTPVVWRIVWYYRAGAAMHNQHGYLHDNLHFRAAVQLGGVTLPAPGSGTWAGALAGALRALATRVASDAAQRQAERALSHALTRLLMGRFLDGAPARELFCGLAHAWAAARRSGAADARLAVLRKALAFLTVTPRRPPGGWLVAGMIAALVRRVRRDLRGVDPAHEAFALQQLGNSMIVCGRWEVAEAYLLRASAALASLGYGYDSLECHVQLNAVHLHQGDFPRLLHDTRITEVEARTLEQPAILRWSLLFKVQAMLRSGLGGVEAARTCLHDIHAIPVRRTLLEDIRIRAVEALLACAQGDLRQVLVLGQDILDVAHHAGPGRFYTLQAFALAVDVLLHVALQPGGTHRAAHTLARQALRRYLALSAHLRPLAPQRGLYLGWLHQLHGRRRQAVRAWRRALAACAAHPSRYDAARLHLLLALHGPADGSAGHREQAVRLFADCGMAGPAYPLLPAIQN